MNQGLYSRNHIGIIHNRTSSPHLRCLLVQSVHLVLNTTSTHNSAHHSLSILSRCRAPKGETLRSFPELCLVFCCNPKVMRHPLGYRWALWRQLLLSLAPPTLIAKIAPKGTFPCFSGGRAIKYSPSSSTSLSGRKSSQSATLTILPSSSSCQRFHLPNPITQTPHWSPVDARNQLTNPREHLNLYAFGQSEPELRRGLDFTRARDDCIAAGVT